MMRVFPLAALLGLAIAPLASAQAPSIANVAKARQGVNVDSGYLANPANRPTVVFRQTVRLQATTWMQLHFGDGTNLDDGSRVHIVAPTDGVEQWFDSWSLREWSYDSAYFAGNEVTIELVAGPGTSNNRVQVLEATRGLVAATPESICGPTDDRQLSNDARQGRIGGGCTGWLIASNMALTAGHCTSGSTILEFNVPLSSSSGQTRPSAPNDQYPYQFVNRLNTGIGSDWGVGMMGTNSNTGLLPGQANGGQWYVLGNVPTSTSGQNIRITGYGTVSAPVSRTLNQVQKTHVGSLAEIRSTSLCYTADTTGGNSGSPVIHENTGNAIGIHTHAGCNSTGGCNQGTRIDRNDLQNEICNAGGPGLGCTPGAIATFGNGCPGTGSTPATCAGVNVNGGSLSGASNGNEYAYTMNATSALSVQAVEFYTRSTSGGNATVTARVYANSGGQPGAQLGTAQVSVGATAGFYAATFASPINVPSGTFFVAVDNAGSPTVLSNLNSGSTGTAFWRRPGQGWSQSGVVTRPSARVICTGGGTPNATPILTASGSPLIGGSVDVALAAAAPNAMTTLLIGVSDSNWAGGTLPFSLGGLGAAGCSLLVSAEASAPAMANANGNTSLSLNIPNSSGLITTDAFVQYFVLDAGANNLGIATTNGGRITIGG